MAVAGIADVGQGAGAIVRIVPERVKVLAFQGNLTLFVHGEDLAGDGLLGAANRSG